MIDDQVATAPCTVPLAKRYGTNWDNGTGGARPNARHALGVASLLDSLWGAFVELTPFGSLLLSNALDVPKNQTQHRP